MKHLKSVLLLLTGVWTTWAGHPGQIAPDAPDFWAFRVPGNVAPPEVKQQDRVETPVDRFILARLEAAGLSSNLRADKPTLIRRACFDLTGLPPTPKQIAEFLADTEKDAFSRLVDRLLDSTAYGERWGRHWLDLARYADTSGDATDMPVPEAYLYRDYVIRAFNEDLPYDQFIVEQLAGDQLNAVEPDHPRWEQRTVATGFIALAQRFGNSKFADMHLVIENTLDTVGKSMLGMSLTCARCHDHKFDPITMKDYYGMYGYFEGTQFPHAGTEHARYREGFVQLDRDPEKVKAFEEWSETLARKSEEAKQVDRERKKDKDNPELRKRRDRLKKELQQLQAQAPQALRVAWAVQDGKNTGDVCMQVAGNPNEKGEKVSRGYLRAITDGHAPMAEGKSGRLELGRWIASKENPLTKRVMANRIWQYHFGRGLVSSSSLFGSQGEPPSHPELLNWLGESFAEHDWSFKAMHRLIMNSSTYQQASTATAGALAGDPDNRLWGRWSRRRLEGEAVRDAILSVSGLLDPNRGGAHPFPQDAYKKYSQGGPFKTDYANHRRSVYQMIRRNGKNAYWELFDAPDRNQSTAQRRISTVPMQALFMMNSEFVRINAEAFAARLQGEDADRIRQAYQRAFAREPAGGESAEALAYLGSFSEDQAISSTAWLSFCRALLASNEFLYLD